MSRDKQTEIANDLNMHCVSLSEQFCGEMSCNACISNWLYNAGYVKASDLAEEIFAEIEKILNRIYNTYVFEDNDYSDDDVAIEKDRLIKYCSERNEKAIKILVSPQVNEFDGESIDKMKEDEF